MNVSSGFESEFCKVEYLEASNIVLLTWKKKCSYENYRKPTSYALSLLEKHSGSSFVVDAVNGFEDEKEDVEWGFSFLLPKMSEAGCKIVVFIMNELNLIEDEMDLWTKEFSKYFSVYKVISFDEAINRIIQHKK